MKIAPAILILFFSANLVAQNSDSLRIKASDPTQIFTFVEGYGGFKFLGNSGAAPTMLDTWEVGFRGFWGIKKFKLGVYLPMSNNTGYNRILDDISIHAGYQIHNNTGLYNATVINVGFVSPSHPDIYDHIKPLDDIMVYPNSSAFYKIYVGYVGALKFSEKVSLYPGLEWSQRTYSNETSSYFPNAGSDFSSIFTDAVKFSGMISYDFAPKNFVQLYLGWSVEKWEGKYGSPEWNEYLSGITQRRVEGNLKYQYAITPAAQAYFNLRYNNLRFEDGYARMTSSGGGLKQLMSLQLGFIYFLL